MQGVLPRCLSSCMAWRRQVSGHDLGRALRHTKLNSLRRRPARSDTGARTVTSITCCADSDIVCIVSAAETPNGLVLSETKVEIQHAGKSRVFPCKIYFDLKINNSILIEPLESVDPVYEGFNEGSFWLSIPNVREPVQCYLTASSVRMGSRPRHSICKARAASLDHRT